MCPRVFRIHDEVCGFDGQRSALRHGVAGIHGEVHDNLLNLSDIRLYLAQPRIRREYEINVRSDESGQHLIKFAYNEI